MNQLENRLSPADDRVVRAWADMRERRAKGQPFRIEDYLADQAFASSEPDIILDLVYGEYALRVEAGEIPTADEYVERFPDLAERIRRQIAVHAALSSEPEAPATETVDARALPSAVPEGLPEQIGKYRIVEHLGSGGQAVAYRAVHSALGQDVVVKVSRFPADEAKPDRLAAEGRILAAMRHPYLARVYDFDEHRGCPFIVMEYVRGRSLEQRAQQHRFSPLEAASLVGRVARGIAHAHGRGVVHLDIKPANILLAEDGHPRVIDFGLGRLRPSWGNTPTDAPEISGTLAYMAPERARGDDTQVAERGDIFGLGGVLYFLLTGKSPIRGETANELWEKARVGAWDPSLLQRPEIPKPLRQICDRCLAANSADRYGSADALAEQLERFARGPVPARRTLVTAGAGLLAFGLIFWFCTRSLETEAEVPEDAQIHLSVWNGERYIDSLRLLPLQTGNEVRIEADRPKGFHAALLWADPDGNVHELATVRAEQDTTAIVYPAGRHSVPVEGGPGTELILLCLRRDKPIDIDSVRAKLAKVRQWPALPPSSALSLNRGGVTVVNTGRGPGRPKLRDDPEGEVADRLRELQSELRAECETVVALVVSHHKP